MAPLGSRFLTTLILGLAIGACGSTQTTPITPEDVPPADAPPSGSPPQSPDAAMPAPNGEPTNTPPDVPPPQGLNDSKRAP